MTHDCLLPTLRALECALHDPRTRHDRQRLSELLHPDFHELGRSGTAYTRSEMMARLLEQDQDVKLHTQDFVVHALAPSIVLLTYRSAHVSASGAVTLPTNRSSIWQLTPSGWTIVFHQGTPTEVFTPESP